MSGVGSALDLLGDILQLALMDSDRVIVGNRYAVYRCSAAFATGRPSVTVTVLDWAYANSQSTKLESSRVFLATIVTGRVINKPPILCYSHVST